MIPLIVFSVLPGSGGSHMLDLRVQTQINNRQIGMLFKILARFKNVHLLENFDDVAELFQLRDFRFFLLFAGFGCLFGICWFVFFWFLRGGCGVVLRNRTFLALVGFWPFGFLLFWFFVFFLGLFGALVFKNLFYLDCCLLLGFRAFVFLLFSFQILVLVGYLLFRFSGRRLNLCFVIIGLRQRQIGDGTCGQTGEVIRVLMLSFFLVLLCLELAV